MLSTNEASDAGLTEELARAIYEASDDYDFNGVAWEYQYGAAKQQALRQAGVVAARVAAAEQRAAEISEHRHSDALTSGLEGQSTLEAKVRALADEWATEGSSLVRNPYDARDLHEGSTLERCADAIRAALSDPDGSSLRSTGQSGGGTPDQPAAPEPAAVPQRDAEHTHETGGAWYVTQWQVPGCPACAAVESAPATLEAEPVDEFMESAGFAPRQAEDRAELAERFARQDETRSAAEAEIGEAMEAEGRAVATRYRLAWQSARRRAVRAWTNYYAAEGALRHHGLLHEHTSLSEPDSMGSWCCGVCDPEAEDRARTEERERIAQAIEAEAVGQNPAAGPVIIGVKRAARIAREDQP